MFINPQSKQHSTKKDFYSVPGHEEYSISRNGEVIITATGKDVKVSKDGHGYPIIKWGLSLHRALALTFIPPLEGHDYEDLYVNHIDGIKQHSYLSNLEWVTPSGNSLHAYQTGLRNDNIPLLCKDYSTGEITEHYSLQDCARYIERNAGTLHDYMKSPNKHKRLISNRYAIIKPGEEWPIITDYTVFNDSGWQVDWVVFDRVGNRLIITSSLAAAARIMGLNDNMVGAAVRRGLMKNRFVYQFKDNKYLLSRKRDLETHLKPLLKANGLKTEDIRKEERASVSNNRHKVVRPPTPIRVTDLRTNEVKDYPSSEYFCEHVLYGTVKKNTFQCYIQRHNGIYKDRYKVEYLNKNHSCPTVE